MPAILASAPLVLAVFEHRGVWAPRSARYGSAHARVAAAGAVVVRRRRDPLGRISAGAYAPVGDRSYHAGQVLGYLWWHVAELSLYVLVVPLAALIVLVVRAPNPRRAPAGVPRGDGLADGLRASRSSPRSRPSSPTGSRSGTCSTSSRSSASRSSPGSSGARPVPARSRPPRRAVSAGLVSGAIPFDSLHHDVGDHGGTPRPPPFWSLQDRFGHDWIRSAAGALRLCLAAAFLLVPRRYALVLPLLVLGLWILAVRPIWWGKHGFEQFSRGALFQGIRTADRDWVDSTLPKRRQGGVPVDGAGPDRLHGEPERVLQPCGRARSTTSPTRPRAASRRRVSGSTRARARVTFEGGSPSADRYRSRIPRSSRTGAHRSRQGLGDHALARAPPARLGVSLSPGCTRRTRGPGPGLHTETLPTGSPHRLPVE